MTVYFNINDEPTWIPAELDPVWQAISRTPGDAETEDRWRQDERQIDGGFSGCEAQEG